MKLDVLLRIPLWMYIAAFTVGVVFVSTGMVLVHKLLGA